ncbi:dihydroorotase [Halococcus saccharolyticus]|uniref:Dihydroorotase n=1 Tax=Halococcus saccharolyticus DSM 5350 TaxID=1227455 RepID=M0MFP1_9EURY|nr:dihydroorotase [Halococcus saccharolyticus]EMA43255.1 dihydroorotase [Halococcus saccharolyticus DSM 5350]
MLIANATLADGRRRDVRVEDERIAAVERRLSADADETELDAAGKLLLPGMIDAHVHFREPGFPHKETWANGSRAAAAGGVTTVVDQPNTQPPTVDGETFDEKSELAAASIVDFGINGGVTSDWRSSELLDRPLFALGEVFLADSTGEMGIDADLFADAVTAATERGVAVTVHAEDATRFDTSARDRNDADAWSAFRIPEAERVAVERACEVGQDAGAQLHIAHTSTPEGIDVASEAGMTCEVTPHHLLHSRDDLDELGTFGRMNPPLRSEERRKGVYERVADGTVDLIATDHAPHTREEKDAGIWDAPSGVPGVETALPLLLAEARAGRLDYERVRDLTAANPAAVFDLPRKGRVEAGKDADLVLVDPDATREIRGTELRTDCGWTPFDGFEGVFPEWTMVRGETVYRRDEGDEERFGAAVGENVRSGQ